LTSTRCWMPSSVNPMRVDFDQMRDFYTSANAMSDQTSITCSDSRRQTKRDTATPVSATRASWRATWLPRIKDTVHPDQLGGWSTIQYLPGERGNLKPVGQLDPGWGIIADLAGAVDRRSHALITR
jgi:hypothetical protein